MGEGGETAALGGEAEDQMKKKKRDPKKKRAR